MVHLPAILHPFHTYPFSIHAPSIFQPYSTYLPVIPSLRIHEFPHVHSLFILQPFSSNVPSTAYPFTMTVQQFYFPRMYHPSIVHQCPIHCPLIFHEVAPIFHTSASNFPQTFHQFSINVHPHFPSFPPFPFISLQTPFTMDNIPSIPSPCIDCIIRSNVRHGCSVVAPCCNPLSIHAINALSRNFPSILHTFSIIPCPSKFLNIFINAPSFPSFLHPFCPSFLSG